MISICLASKGRKAKLENMVYSSIKMRTSQIPLEFCIYLDENDPTYDIQILDSNVFVKTYFGPRLPTSSMTNFMYSQSNGDVLLYAADDIEFKTKGWDEIVLNELREPAKYPQVLMTNDLSKTSGKLATHAFVTRAYCELVDYLLPPYFESEFCDNWITDVAREAQILKYRDDLILEHKHYLWEKSMLDETYKYRKSRYRHHELSLYYKMMFLMRKREIAILKKAVI